METEDRISVLERNEEQIKREKQTIKIRIWSIIISLISISLGIGVIYVSLRNNTNQLKATNRLQLVTEFNNSFTKLIEMKSDSLRPEWQNYNKKVQFELCENILKQIPKTSITAAQYSVLGRNLLTFGDTNKAIKYCLLADTMDRSQFTCLAIAMIYEAKKDFDKAKCYYEKAISIDNSFSIALILYSQFLSTHYEMYDSAKAYIEKAIHFCPKSAMAHNGYGNLLGNSHFKQYNEAITQYKTAIELDSLYYDAYANLAITFSYNFHNYDSALIYFRKLLHFSPNNIHGIIRIAEAFENGVPNPRNLTGPSGFI
jgi:tetratricopeptide (TPR) repeat protein